jgi:hypothetical protein
MSKGEKVLRRLGEYQSIALRV